MRWSRLLPSARRLVPSSATASCASFVCDGPDEPISPEPVAPNRSRIVFTGTGNSTGIPLPHCLLGMKDDPECVVSQLAMRGSPDRNRNYRGNPALLIQHRSATGRLSNIQIDVGKTFRESTLRWYPRFGVDHLEAVIITHDHADAFMGLDDLRTVQQLPRETKIGEMAFAREVIPPLPVFVSERHMSKVQSTFPYLVPQENADDVPRFTAKLAWTTMEDFKAFSCPSGLEVLPVPVFHGGTYTCQAFVFGKSDRVAYVSDVTEVPDKTMEVLQESPIALLVTDTLLLDKKHPAHFGLEDAIDLARKLRPKKTLLVGMSGSVEHHTVNAQLKRLQAEEGLDIQLAYDGQSLELDL
mmetsp:Transcript_10436/g.18792  ORF Transcript_10436/g.18792 Transcript_10436/m.18792 type:complete len:355 (-) Transcript_10436:9-1073(-)